MPMMVLFFNAVQNQKWNDISQTSDLSKIKVFILNIDDI